MIFQIQGTAEKKYGGAFTGSNPFNRKLRNRNPPIQYCLNVRKDKGLPRVPCYHGLFFPVLLFSLSRKAIVILFVPMIFVQLYRWG